MVVLAARDVLGQLKRLEGEQLGYIPLIFNFALPIRNGTVRGKVTVRFSFSIDREFGLRILCEGSLGFQEDIPHFITVRGNKHSAITYRDFAASD